MSKNIIEFVDDFFSRVSYVDSLDEEDKECRAITCKLIMKIHKNMIQEF